MIPTEDDLIAALIAAQPPRQQPGEYNANQIERLLRKAGIQVGSAELAIGYLRATGAEVAEREVIASYGKTCTVYRLVKAP